MPRPLKAFIHGQSPWHPSSEAELLRRTDLHPRRLVSAKRFAEAGNPPKHIRLHQSR